MYIKEFAINRYGPLTVWEKKELGMINLFYAPNEEGKTLTIDALLKMFFKPGELRVIKEVERVPESPEGYVVITTKEEHHSGNGKEYRRELKLPEAGSYPQLFGISALEFRNIFLIRNSDLTLTGESDFYKNITGRLTGMRTEEIRKVQAKIEELGRITPRGDFRDTSPDKLKSRHNEAGKLLERAKRLFFELEEEGFGRIEEELAELEERIRQTGEKLDLINAAYYRERLEKGREALNRLRRARIELSGLEGYREEDFEAWRRAEANLEMLRNELYRLDNEIVEKKTNLLDAEKWFKTKREELDSYRHYLTQCSQKVESLLSDYDRLASLLQEGKVMIENAFFKKSTVISTLVMLISLVGSLLQPSWWLLTLLFVSFMVNASYFIARMIYLRKQSNLSGLEARICSGAEDAGLHVNNVAEARAEYQRLKETLNRKESEVKEAENESAWWKKENERLKKEREGKIKRIKEEEGKIERIKTTVDVGAINSYYSMLKKKQELKHEQEKQKSILKSHFGGGSETIPDEELVAQWDRWIEQLDVYEHRAVNLSYDENTFNRLKKELNECERVKKELEAKFKQRSGELYELEKEINRVTGTAEEGYLVCQTLTDLEIALEKLKEWLTAHEQKRESAYLARNLFEDIAREEGEKVATLFGFNKPASSYFKKITNHRYSGVDFDNDTEKVNVLLKNGEKLEAEKLSGGAYDQLYFSIRMALGDVLLGGGKGFLILDDPFIKADLNRLETMLRLLEEACEAGWQIIYFSAKGEVREALDDKIKRGLVREFSI